MKEGDRRMTDVRLVSKGARELKPLVEAALANELRLIEAGLQQAKNAIRTFESRYQMPSQDFLVRYENDEIEESMDFAEWIGEIRLLERLQEKAETLRDIRFESWKLFRRYQKDDWTITYCPSFKRLLWEARYPRRDNQRQSSVPWWNGSGMARIRRRWNKPGQVNVFLSIHGCLNGAHFSLWQYRPPQEIGTSHIPSSQTSGAGWECCAFSSYGSG